MKIKFDFEHCFGIERLEKEFDFREKQSVAVIYAPNGMMKSSFAKTCEEMSKVGKAKPQRGKSAAAEVDPICDRLNPDAGSKHDILIDGTAISPECIFVADPDQVTFDASQQVTDFLASKTLKDEYDRIVGLLEKARKEFVKAVGSNSVSQSSDCDKEIAEAFLGDENASLYGCIEPVAEMLRDDALYYDVKFDDLFDDKGEVKTFLEENRDLLNDYATQYNRLLSESEFFHTQDGKSFGTYQAAQLGKAFKGEEYFSVKHKLVLRNNTEITSAQAFSTKIEEEKKRIISDEGLKITYDEIAKKLEANTDLRNFSRVITLHPEWIVKLSDYEGFRKEVLMGYINHPDVRGKFDALKQVFEANKDDLEKVIKASHQEQALWLEIVKIFNLRFHTLPFKVEVQNQENVLLKQEVAKLAFEYQDQHGGWHEQSKEALLKILSKGERRAFLIMQFLFAIEARKKWDETSLIVMDDISDSFDYQNKYAIVEYLKDMAEEYNDKFKIILLTHNFDFYRTVTLRLKGMVQQYMAVKGNDGVIRIEQGVYVMRTPFELEMKNSEKGSNLIALIPFVRNLVDYYQEKDSPDFMTLTACLHLLDEPEKNAVTDSVTDTDLVTIFEKVKKYKVRYEPQGERVIDIVFREADKIESADEVHEVMIEDKVILSIAIRLKAEAFLKRELKAAGKTDEELKTKMNQTSEWIDLYKTLNPDRKFFRVMEKVNMMTPEYIHLNSFMYEPLIDMSIWHLRDLYKEVKALLAGT